MKPGDDVFGSIFQEPQRARNLKKTRENEWKFTFTQYFKLILKNVEKLLVVEIYKSCNTLKLKDFSLHYF